jgi:protoporphyrinogen oxidase
VSESVESSSRPDVVIIGAGPAGLTAAYQLSKRGVTSTVLEADDVVGGISRTAVRDGWRFDIGGHRFFTKVTPVEELWFEILGPDDFLRRPRKSRIYYDEKFITYPLVPMNALRSLGFLEAVRCVGSYIWVRIHPPKDQTNLEGFYAARFGWRLYRIFFKTYTEKLWGVPVSDIQSDWGAQRVKNLSLFRAVWEAMKPKWLRRGQDKSQQVTSLIEEFNYPKYGPGMMWERATELVTARGTKVVFQSRVDAVHHRDGRAVAVTATTDGAPTRYDCTDVISSMPLGALVRSMDPAPPAEVVAAADGLTYRDFITVALVVPADRVPWDDNWIYVHAPEVQTMRIQNFGSWSPYLVKDGRNVLGLEYTVWETDPAWTAPDAELIERGKHELEELGLMEAADVEAGYVVRMPKAYPMYDATFKTNVDVLRAWLAEHAANVYPVGRNGMHRYNNQDHSMYTAMLSVENIFGAHHDVWTVNVEADYHEERDDA